MFNDANERSEWNGEECFLFLIFLNEGFYLGNLKISNSDVIFRNNIEKKKKIEIQNTFWMDFYQMKTDWNLFREAKKL